jgi:hypothetical protein
MPIIVKHSGNVAPQLFGAFGGGKGKREAEDATEAMRIATQKGEAAKNRAFQSNQANADRVFRANSNREERDWRSKERELEFDRDRLALEGRADLTGRESDLQFQRELELQDRSAEQRRREANDLLGETNVQLTNKQIEEDNRLADAEAEIMTSPEFTEDEKAEAIRNIRANRAKIQPVARRKPASEWREGQGIGDTWRSDDGNAMMTRDKDGNVKKLYETNANPTWKDRLDARKMFIQQFTEEQLDKEGNSIGEKTDWKKVESAVNEMFKSSSQPSAGPVGPRVKDFMQGELQLEDALNNAQKLMGGSSTGLKSKPSQTNKQPAITPAFNTVDEAEASKLPIGTEIIINGRRAIIE